MDTQCSSELRRICNTDSYTRIHQLIDLQKFGIHQLCVDTTGCPLEDLPRLMGDKDGEREREREREGGGGNPCC